MKDLTFRNGRKYFYMAGSHALYPQYMQVSDQKLVCSVLDETSGASAKLYDCNDGFNFDFGQIGLYQSKHKVMNITNLGHETVLIDWVNKTHENDELSMSYKLSYEEYKKLYPELKPRYFEETENSEFLNRFIDKQRMGLFILPGHTVTLTFSLEGVISSLKGIKASAVMTHAVEFSF